MARELHYPKIPDTRDFPMSQFVAFEKYDGTNFHFEWDRDFGWHSFGTRRDAFNLDANGIEKFCSRHRELSEVVDVFQATVEPTLSAHLTNVLSVPSFTAFFEFLGESSFAGQHKENEPKQLILIDASSDGQMLGPLEFLNLPAELPIARVIYRGRFTGAFAEDVRNGKFDVTEGVICKTGTRGSVQLAKIKTSAYMQKLKVSFGDQWQNYWE